MLITFVGMPSSGKSSTASALGRLLNAQSFLEPEEADWPPLVMRREIYGRFTALSWFRTARVPNLFEADRIRQGGGIAIVDSYYDVLVRHYLGKQPFSWLLPEDDPYFDVAKQMVEVDYWTLPRPDVIVLLKLDEATWLQFMHARGRNFDKSAALDQHFAMQNLFEDACVKTAADFAAKIVTINQVWGSAAETAENVRAELDI